MSEKEQRELVEEIIYIASTHRWSIGTHEAIDWYKFIEDISERFLKKNDS